MRTKDMPPYKKKKVSDLIRYIRNSADTEVGSRSMLTPNYSILLGAGASRTSGIRTGGQLIEKWKEEIYRDHNDDETLSIEDYFKSEKVSDWFEENTAYSCLFEERFDLQRQRRVFVENEVSGKTPSIGYAYLVRLIEKGFFNTVFTTNFDDLLNEAFYRFSKNRPIVCAHDSSISGVTITSSRPKIIKLHGDYLFDNIKATQRETESLETNMRMKFEEFAKDFGLIVVGYSGGDRSIMDIISELLRSKEYFKNGIYWCVPKGNSELHPELKKLLNKDRVFLVEIDGFDELFAELNHHLNNGSLPIDDSFLGFKYQDQIISDLTENKFLNLNCHYLADDCRRLKDGLENNRYKELLKTVVRQKSEFHDNVDKVRAQRKSTYQDMTPDEINEINELKTEAFLENNKEKVLDELRKKNIFALKEGLYKIQLLEIESDLIGSMPDEDVRKYSDALIAMNPKKLRYYEVAVNKSEKYSQKFFYYDKALEKFSNSVRLLNNYIDCLLDYCEEAIDANSCQKEIDLIKILLDKSLEVHKSINNEAYLHKYRWIKIKYCNDTKKGDEEIEALCKQIKKLSSVHPTTINILHRVQSKDFSVADIIKALDFYKKTNKPDAVEKIYMEYVNYLKTDSKINEILNCFEEYEKEYIGSDSYKMFKADILNRFEFFEDALKLLESFPESKVTRKKILNTLWNLSRENEARNLFEGLSKHEQTEILKEYYNITDQYSKLSDLYTKDIQSGTDLDKNNLNAYAYALLREEKYPDVKRLLEPYHKNNSCADGAIIVNYYYSSLKLGEKKEKIEKKLRERIIDNKFGYISDFDRLGAACVIGDVSAIISFLGKVLNNCPVDKYTIKDWPIMQPYKNDPRIVKLLTPDPKKLSTSDD